MRLGSGVGAGVVNGLELKVGWDGDGVGVLGRGEGCEWGWG